MSKQELTRRYLFFIAGLYVNSLGIRLITKAEWCTSPISSIPYTLSIGFPLSLGMFTLFYSLLLIVIQLVHPGTAVSPAVLASAAGRQFWLQLPGECTIKAISSTWNKDFGKTKVAVDLTMALSAAALGFFLYGALTGVREGTLISALLVGLIARWINQHLGSRAQTLLSTGASASPVV